jgi:hypothetical protein
MCQPAGLNFLAVYTEFIEVKASGAGPLCSRIGAFCAGWMPISSWQS